MTRTFTVIIAIILSTIGGHCYAGNPVVWIRQTAPNEEGKLMEGGWSGTVIARVDTKATVPASPYSRSATTEVPAYVYQILTCAHMYNTKYPVKVMVNRDRWVEGGKFIAIDKDVDLGMIQLFSFEVVPTMPVSLAEIDEAGTGTIIGYGHGIRRERRTEYSFVHRWDRDLIRTEAMVRHGDSGCPLVINNKLAGIAVLTLHKNEKAGARPWNEEDGFFVRPPEIHKFLVDKCGWEAK